MQSPAPHHPRQGMLGWGSGHPFFSIAAPSLEQGFPAGKHWHPVGGAGQGDTGHIQQKQERKVGIWRQGMTTFNSLGIHCSWGQCMGMNRCSKAGECWEKCQVPKRGTCGAPSPPFRDNRIHLQRLQPRQGCDFFTCVLALLSALKEACGGCWQFWELVGRGCWMWVLEGFSGHCGMHR